MSSGKQIINSFVNGVNSVDPGIMKTAQALATTAQLQIYDLNARTIACQCECLGMNADNCISATQNIVPPYGDAEYKECMIKWKLIDKDGKPII